jgi:quinol monooxygenase YgiN
MIVVTAVLKAADDKGDDLEQAFRKLMPKVLDDPGTVAYVVHRGMDDPTTFFVYEKYENADALKAHSSTAHFKEFSQAVGSLLAARPEVTLYRQVI